MIFHRYQLLLLLLAAFGAGLFVWQIFAGDSGQAWQVFLVNLLFFSAVAQSGSVLAAIYHLSEGRWGSRVMPLALGLGSFLPISFVLFIVLFAGFPYLPKYSAELPARQLWLDRVFLSVRDLVGLAILHSLSLVFSYRFLNAAMDGVSDRGGIHGAPQDDLRSERERHTPFTRRFHSLTTLAVLVLITYSLVFSLLGFDLVMALDTQWYSTLFGGYFFISSFYIGLAAITISVFLVSRYGKADQQVQIGTLQDLGKLVFAFCLLTAYFFWAQYLVIWYGNLPEEVGFVARRFVDPSWGWLTWTTIALVFAVPLFLLLSESTKQNVVLCVVAAIVLLGMWLERYLLIVPSLAPNAVPRLGWMEVVITLSFLALVLFSYGLYLNYYDALKSKSELAAVRSSKTG